MWLWNTNFAILGAIYTKNSRGLVNLDFERMIYLPFLFLLFPTTTLTKKTPKNKSLLGWIKLFITKKQFVNTIVTTSSFNIGKLKPSRIFCVCAQNFLQEIGSMLEIMLWNLARFKICYIGSINKVETYRITITFAWSTMIVYISSSHVIKPDCNFCHFIVKPTIAGIEVLKFPNIIRLQSCKWE